MKPILTDYIMAGGIFSGSVLHNALWCREQIDRLTLYIEKQSPPFSPFVHLFAKSNIKTVFAFIASVKAGKIAVILDPDIGMAEYDEIFNDTPPALTFHLDTSTDAFIYEREITIHSVHNGDICYDHLEDVCTMVYTAASDGYAKAAMLTHKNMLACATAIGKGSGYDHTTICCAALPFDHLFGLQTGIIAPFLFGGKIQIADIMTKDAIIETVKNIGCNRITHLYSVPVLLFLFGKFRAHVKMWRPDITITSGSCKLEESIRNYFKKEYDIEVYEGYGLTEASPVCTWQYPGEELVSESVGKEIDCCKVRAVDDNFVEVTDSIGEIVVKGENVMKGYYNRKESTRYALNNGWVKTGDLGMIDRHGNVYITGLKKRMLNNNGKKVYPAEIERFLSNVFKLPVSIESKVKKSGIILEAIVQCSQDDPVLIRMSEWCRANLSREKRPRVFSSADKYHHTVPGI